MKKFRIIVLFVLLVLCAFTLCACEFFLSPGIENVNPDARPPEDLFPWYSQDDETSGSDEVVDPETPENPDTPEEPETPEEPGTTVEPENPEEQEPSVDPGEPTDPETPEEPGTTVDPENPEEQEPSIDPGEPTDPETPEEPGVTVDPETPEEPENPEEQEPSINPGEPTDPETPEEPGTTVDPENPDEQEPSINPGEPTDPETPEEPGTTVDPENPEEQEPSINPGEPTDPATPEEPGTTVDPENPDEQEPSVDLGEPTDPENPEEPDTTVDPENPDEQEPGVDPSEPADPETPENPGTTVDPENPEEQEPSVDLGEPTDPENPEEPGVTVDPETPEEPENPEEQEPSINPGEPTDPETPEEPGTTVDPENPEEQEPSINPGEPTDPENPEEPGVTVDPETPEEPENPEEQEPSINPGEPAEPEIPEEPEVIYYTITFVGMDGDVIAEFKVEEGATIVPPEPKEYDGYAFLGWLEMPSSAERDMAVVGEYAEVYAVSLHMYGEDGDILNQTLSFISGAPLSEQLSAEYLSALLPAGYELPSEFADSEYYAQEVNEDMAIEIRCEKILYKITLHKLNGEIENMYAEYGETITLSPLRAPGYLFRGWYANEACTLPYDQAEITQNIDIYSKWEEVTDESQFELASDDDIFILIDNPHAQYVVTGQIDFAKIADEGLEFTGVFDGGNYTANLGNKPLFKSNSGTIRNLRVAVNADNASTITAQSYGAICAINTGIIEDINLSGSITTNAETSVKLGGVCGENKGTIKDIELNISITVSGKSDAYIGSVAGNAVASTVENISGVGVLTYAGTAMLTRAGGIYGQISGGDNIISQVELSVDISGCALAAGMAGQTTSGKIALRGDITVSYTVTSAMRTDDITFGGTVDSGQADLNITKR